MTKTITVEGDLSAADTEVVLNTQGSVASPSMVVPAGSTKIDKIVAAVAADLTAVGAAGFYAKLGGPAVLGGEQVIALGDQGGSSGTDTAGVVGGPIILEDLNISVRAQDTIVISAEMAGDDLGDASICITLLFA